MEDAEVKDKKVEEKGESFKEETPDKTARIIEERKKKIITFFKKSNLWVIGFLIIALILGIYIRSLPMQDHGGNPGLWDITTNTWTLGPDLDPWLFLRYAETIVKDGKLPEVDALRNVPLGFKPSGETVLLPYMIASTYWVFSAIPLGISDVNIEFAGAVFPVVMFAFTILAFFLFVREVFIKKDKESKIKANAIALISSFFMIVIPAFLSRTVAGIPEKESAAFFFMFLTFFLFLRAWKARNIKNAAILGILSGISTALMGLIWGGVIYIFVTIAIASFVGFVLNKVHKKEFIAYSSWIVLSFLLTVLFSGATLKSLSVSLDTGLSFLMFFVFLVHFILWNTKAGKIKFFRERRIPKNIISLIVAIILLVLLSSVIFGPTFIIEKIKDLNQVLFTPVTGRWNITVAENRQPYFGEWSLSFGPFLKNIPLLFWLFFIGSIVLFRDMLKGLKKKDMWILVALYVLFFFGLVFSRYAPHPNVFDGENFISKFFYYGSALLLIGSLIYYYIRYNKEGHHGFEAIDYNLLFLFALLILCLFTARSAVRLIMVLAPIAPIFLSYLIISTADRYRKAKDETWKILMVVLLIIVVLLSVFIFWKFYQQIGGEAYSFIPSYYNQQWQKAMQWVREETPQDAVFAHWWDYGYWVQSIGKRSTVIDGGNAITYWNYLMGRYVLTGDNEKDALEFLYTHNSTHLLIDSTDIGKYTAFSSIGSDINYDRYSWIPVMVSDETQIQETRNGTMRIYQGGAAIDEDTIYEQDDKEISLPAQQSAIIGVVLEISQDGTSLKQPEGVFYYQGVQYRIPLRYAYYDGELLDYKKGLEGCVYIVQRVYRSQQGGVGVDNSGAIMYLSPRLMRGMLTQVYILNDPFENFPHLKLVHSEQNLIASDLNSQGLNLGEFIYFRGIQGPIKIWEISYTGKETVNEAYLDRDASKYISWKL